MRQRPLVLCLLATLCAVTLSTRALAQETTGTIIGTVTDGSGAVLPGVTVVLKHIGTGQTIERVTNDQGQYTAPLLPIGAYEVTFTLSGFEQRVVRGVSLSVNDRIVIDAALSVGGVSEVIEVTGTQAVQPTAALQTLIGSERVQELPLNNRSFVQLATLAPGVSNDLTDEVGTGLEHGEPVDQRRAERRELARGRRQQRGRGQQHHAPQHADARGRFRNSRSSRRATPRVEAARSLGGIVNVVTKSARTASRAAVTSSSATTG
jgi:hypothetical protein